MAKILVVDDEQIMRDLVVDTLTLFGHTCAAFCDPLVALDHLEEENPDLVVSDFKMPHLNGLEFLKQVQKKRPGQSFLIMTAFGTIEMAVEAIKNGADNFIEKPFQPEILEHQVQMVLENQRIRQENRSLRQQLTGRAFVGQGRMFHNLQHFVEEVAPTNATVLITGESGVGKEVLARAIHYQSLRACGSFIKVNCAALPENLIESELFGHEKGAFTGALRTRKGKFEQAQGGTLLLDEIGEMPLGAQSKLLRVLQEREVVRVGADEEIKVDVRVICTTNRDLRKEVEAGRFREDLFYRLNVVPIQVGPLRERQEDISGLVKHFIDKINGENGFAVEGIEPDALAALERHHWPGNIRQLENAVERAMVFCKAGNLRLEHFDLPGTVGGTAFLTKPGSNEAALSLHAGMTVAQAEQALILKTLEDCKNNRTRAAEMLDISIRTLRNKLHEYGYADGKDPD
ncbi:MAG TPA: sigma-54 dependent transcriptional regulator [Fibrobacteraceae bacterium]|nr:sigma-54 dependent transcriptional regulator [Fibrobacteraceae bacterium]